jgi:AraC-like DNA-binding protein
MTNKKLTHPIIINDFSLKSEYILYTPTLRDIPFQPTGAGIFYSGKKYFVERDNLDMYLILLTTKGSGRITYRGNSFLLLPEHAVLLNASEYHKYQTSEISDFWNFKWIRFSTNFFGVYDWCVSGGNSSDGIPVLNTDFESMVDLFIEYIKCNENIKDLLMSNLISGLLTVLCEQSTPVSRQNADNEFHPRINNAKKYIIDHYSHDIHIGTLASISNLSPSSFIRYFSSVIGLTPYAFLQKTRINQALVLLETTGMSINEIALAVGFNDQNNFAKQFKKYMGVTPTAYRNMSYLQQT